MKPKIWHALALAVGYPILWSLLVFLLDWFGPTNVVLLDDQQLFMRNILLFPVLLYFYMFHSFGLAPVLAWLGELFIYYLLRSINIHYLLKVAIGVVAWFPLWYAPMVLGLRTITQDSQLYASEDSNPYIYANLLTLGIMLLIVTRSGRSTSIDNHSQ